MRITAFLLFAIILCVSCKKNPVNHGSKSLLVEIDGNFLYKEDLQAALPFGISGTDSITFADNYIRNWIKDILLYDKAKNNIPNSNEIDVLVENYRRSLIVHAYQQELIKQRLPGEIPEQEILDYYNQNKQLFLLNYSLIKGLFIKVLITAPQLDDVRDWYKTETYEAVEKLEKYSFLNAVNYRYFYDKWMLTSEVLGYIPLNIPEPEKYIREKRQIEWKDNEFYYFLNVSEFCEKGEVEPYEFARAEIKDMLLNMRQVGFMEEIKDGLYEQAEKRNKIIYNFKHKE